MPKGCSKCGTRNADDAKFCRGCGAALGTALPDTLAAPPDASCPACGALNPASARFCATCGADQSEVTMPAAFSRAPTASVFPETPPHPASAHATSSADLVPPTPAPAQPKGLWIGAGVLLIALVAGGAWWLKSSHGSVASLDEPAAPAASTAAATAYEPAAATAPASAPDPASAAAPAAIAPAPTATTTPAVEAPPPVIDTNAASAAAALAKDQAAARVARAKVLRAQREQAAASQAAAARAADQDAAARHRADESRARATQAALPVQAAAPAAPAHPRTAQETCADGNLIVRGICEARVCARREHTDEPLCTRLRAADDKRRQQD